jgi:chromate transporter
MVLLKLFWAFFKVGLFTVGGGYAMLPLIQHEMEKYGWLTAQQFIDIIAIAEMTPGAIAVNTATFVGFNISGVPGSIVATTAVALPSLIFMVILARFWKVYQNHPTVKSVFAGVRPAVAGLVASAAIFIGKTALMGQPLTKAFSVLGLDLRTVLIAIAVFIAVRYKKADPIKLLVLSGVVGLIVFRF